MSTALDNGRVNAQAAEFLEWLWSNLDFGPATDEVLNAYLREYVKQGGALPYWLICAAGMDIPDDIPDESPGDLNYE